MLQRGRHVGDVLPGQAPRIGELAGFGQQRARGVHYGLGTRGGPGSEEDQAGFVGPNVGGLLAAAVRDDHVERRPARPGSAQYDAGNVAETRPGEQVVERFGVGEAAERLGGHHSGRPYLLDELTQFVFPVERGDRAAHRAGVPDRQAQHVGFPPVGRLPAHHVAGPDARSGQPRCSAFDHLEQLLVGQLMAAFDDGRL